MHMSKNSEIVNKNIFPLAVQIVGKNIVFYYFVMYRNHNVSIYHAMMHNVILSL
jgi:hypothetical protein